MCRFNFFLGAVSKIEVQITSVFPTWLPHVVTCDVIIMTKSVVAPMVKISSQSDKQERRKTRKFCADKQTDRQTDRQTNGPKRNTLSFGEGKN